MNNHNGHDPIDFSHIPDLGNIGAATAKGTVRKALELMGDGAKGALVIWVQKDGNIGWHGNLDAMTSVAVVEVFKHGTVKGMFEPTK